MKKIIAIALALMLCVGMLSVSAFAAFEVDSLAVVGDGIPGVPAWAPEAPEGDMTKTADGIYEKTLELPAGTNMQFKIAGNDGWVDSCNFGSATIVLGEKADLACGGDSGNMSFSATEAMTIKITVDLTGDVATILVVDANAAGGDDTTTGGDDTTTGGDDTTTGGDDTTTGGDDTTTGGDDTTVEIDPNANYFVAGQAGLCGVEWEPGAEANKMTVNANGTYSITYKNVAAGSYEFKIVKNGSWDNDDWGAEGLKSPVNFKIEVAEADDVTITFNPATGKIAVSGAKSNVPATGDMGMTAVFVVLAVACCGVVALVCTKKKFF